jgi:cell division protein FtsB
MQLKHLAFPLAALALAGYFAYHLSEGDHGLTARTDLEKRVGVLKGELEGLAVVRQRLERDVGLMRAESLDPDMLDERARAILNLAGEDDLVVLRQRTLGPEDEARR